MRYQDWRNRHASWCGAHSCECTTALKTHVQMIWDCCHGSTAAWCCGDNRSSAHGPTSGTPLLLPPHPGTLQAHWLRCCQTCSSHSEPPSCCPNSPWQSSRTHKASCQSQEPLCGLHVSRPLLSKQRLPHIRHGACQPHISIGIPQLWQMRQQKRQGTLQDTRSSPCPIHLDCWPMQALCTSVSTTSP